MFATFIAPNHVFEDSFTHPKGTTGLVVCLVITAGNVAWIGAASSSVTLTAIAVERYCTVTSPDGSNGKLTKKKLKVRKLWCLLCNFQLPLRISRKSLDTGACQKIFIEKLRSRKSSILSAPKQWQAYLFCLRGNLVRIKGLRGVTANYIILTVFLSIII